MNDYPYDAAAHQMELDHRQQVETQSAHRAYGANVNINDIYPSKYLKASDLQGRTVKVTIDRISVEDMGNERKPVLGFAGKQKGLALNKSNAQIIASAYSPETNGWIGREIELRPDKTQFNGQLVDCIRVQVPAPHAEIDEFGDKVPF